MKITNIYLKTYNKGNLRAYVDITFENKLTVKQCRLLIGKKGYFVGFPSTKNRDKYFPLVKISDEATEFRNYVTVEVVKKYEIEIKNIQEENQEEDVTKVI